MLISLDLSKLFNITAEIIIAPPTNTLAGGTSFRKIQTHKGAKIVSNNISNPTVTAGVVLEPIVTQMKPKANWGTPNKKPINRSFGEKEKLLVKNIKSNQGYVGLNLSKTDQVDLKIRIISQRIGKFLSATDKNLTPAVGSIEYSLEYEFILDDKIISQSFYDSELYPYDTSNILSNDKITEEIKNSFLDKALDDIKFNLIKISNG